MTMFEISVAGWMVYAGILAGSSERRAPVLLMSAFTAACIGVTGDIFWGGVIAACLILLLELHHASV